MEVLKKSRRPVRAQLTKIVGQINDQLKAADVKKLKVSSNNLDKLIAELDCWDIKVKAQLITDGVEDALVDKEFDEIETYRQTYETARTDLYDFLNGSTASTIPESASETSEEKRRRFRLPEVHLKTFSGDYGDWLGWWSQFKEIHEDDTLNDVTKFQYLKQSMVTGTEAAEIVQGYVMTAGNYKEVVEALKERFGREDFLLQYYVRELLKLVMTNATSKTKVPLPKLHLSLESHLRSLSELKLEDADPATWLFPLVESSLSREPTLLAWHRSTQYRTDGKALQPPKTRLDLLMDFVKTEVRGAQHVELAQKGFMEKNSSVSNASDRSRHPRMKNFEDVGTASGLLNQQVTKCGFCERSHDPDKCYKAASMKMDDRRALVRKNNLCFQCLRSGHIRSKCRCRVKCTSCGGKHLAIICMKSNQKREHDNATQEPPKKKRVVQANNLEAEDIRITTQSISQCHTRIQLNTLRVKVRDAQGNFTVVRLIGDSGSQRSYASPVTLEQANGRKIGEEWLQNILFGGVVTVPKRFPVKEITLYGLSGGELTLDLLEKDKITGPVRQIPVGPWITEFEKKGVIFSDVGNDDSEPHILIGNDYWGIFRTGRMETLENGLVADETVFGWTLGGPLPVSSSFSVTTLSVGAQDIQKLWSLESIGIRDPSDTKTMKEEETASLEHFRKTVLRDEEGRYIVSLPWKIDCRYLPTNEKIAEQRLRRTTFNLKKQSKTMAYHTVFTDWKKEGLISQVSGDGKGHYLPHRPVYKDSLTTPVRPVFDASCRDGRSPSLNDCLFKGPNTIELIPSMLLRFGEKKIGVSADIRKAFQMLKVNEEDQPFQRFLWWEDDTCEKLVVYQHQRVVFGLTCSPFLLGATINYHLQSFGDDETAKKLQRSFYVDNLISTVDSKEEYAKFKEAAIKRMNLAKMELRQWESSFEVGDENTSVMQILGVKWNKIEDTLSCVIKEVIVEGPIAKRDMLSVVAQIFDPLGILAPALMIPKILIQETWGMKCGWDDPVPREIEQKFRRWIAGMAKLKEQHLQRHCKVVNPRKREVHVFCDSSSVGMASVAFMKILGDDETKLRFLLCKARLAPMKKITIPRSELVSCVLGVRLAQTIAESLDLNVADFVFWSDSTTALAWIKRIGGDWGVFVRNRVNEILNTTSANQWRHVPGTCNPADLPSRGCSSSQLLESKWIEGPVWLLEEKTPFADYPLDVNEHEISSEVKKTSNSTHVGVSQSPRFSSYRKNVAIWGWVIRYKDKLRGLKQNHGLLTMAEMRRAEKVVIRNIQQETFTEGCKEVGGIHVIRDEDGILRVKTRLTNRADSQDFVLPILLPKEHTLVTFLVNDYHLYYGHGGVQMLCSKLRDKYWIIQSRRVVRRVIRRCVKCKRFTAMPMEVEPSALPSKRVESGETFATTGVDLAGPLFLREGKKVWIVVYTCAVYRGVYLDLVPSLSTKDFLCSLERFIALYGRPNTIYSDNGTNFVGAANLFESLDWKEIETESNVKQIQWIFNPPTAAWWGGWWERIVRMVKDLLKRMLGRSRLSFDELRTVIYGVSATINDRPLTVVTEDSMDMIPLTPAMFMRFRSYGGLPELNKEEGLGKSYLRMKETQAYLQCRFRKEYLGLMVTRGKFKQSGIAVGDLVLVGYDNRKRYEWPLARVVELYAGKDGKIRVAKVKTSHGMLTRPLQRLYPLEIPTSEDCLKLGNVKSNDGKLPINATMENLKLPSHATIESLKLPINATKDSSRIENTMEDQLVPGVSTKMTKSVPMKKRKSGDEAEKKKDAVLPAASRFGRPLRTPIRYGQWCHLIV